MSNPPTDQVLVKPLHGGAYRKVALSSVRRFGRYRRLCDAKLRNCAELDTGEVVLAMQKDQTDGVVKEMRRRLEGAHFETYASRDNPEVFAWEAWQPCRRGNDVCPQGCCA